MSSMIKDIESIINNNISEFIRSVCDKRDLDTDELYDMWEVISGSKLTNGKKETTKETKKEVKNEPKKKTLKKKQVESPCESDNDSDDSTSKKEVNKTNKETVKETKKEVKKEVKKTTKKETKSSDSYESDNESDNSKKSGCPYKFTKGVREGQVCGSNSSSGTYCSKHKKYENEEPKKKNVAPKVGVKSKKESETKEPSPKTLEFSKHKTLPYIWNELTGLILKSKTEKVIIGKIIDNIPLPMEDIDIDLCKSRKFNFDEEYYFDIIYNEEISDSVLSSKNMPISITNLFKQIKKDLEESLHQEEEEEEEEEEENERFNRNKPTLSYVSALEAIEQLKEKIINDEEEEEEEEDDEEIEDEDF